MQTKVKMAQFFLILLFFLTSSEASIYPVRSTGRIPAFERAESMFASDYGPPLGRSGKSEINVQVTGIDLVEEMNEWSLITLFFHADTFQHLLLSRTEVSTDVCSNPNSSVSRRGVGYLQRNDFKIHNHTLNVDVTYPINSSGWIDTQIHVCSNKGMHRTINFEGQISYRNPYGLLPAVFFGLLPFSGFISIGYIVLFACFLCLFLRFRKHVLMLQYGILVVLFMGSLSSILWFTALSQINETGEPICCPYPKLYLLSILLDAAMRTLSRVLLLVVCLGYGITRTRLSKFEWIFMGVIAVLYCGATVADQVAKGNAPDEARHLQATAWSFLELICNLLFVMWIYLALETITKDLRDEHQTAKLEMYESLACTLGVFVLFFTCVTIVAVSNRFGIIHFPVEWEWTQLVVWPVLNFTVSCAICYIWRPSVSSSDYALSTQIPMTEIDDDDDNDKSTSCNPMEDEEDRDTELSSVDVGLEDEV